MSDRLELFDLDEAATWLRVTPETLRAWAEESKIPCWQPGGRGGKLLFPRQVIEDWIRQEACAKVTSPASLSPLDRRRPKPVPAPAPTAPGALAPLGASDDW